MAARSLLPLIFLIGYCTAWGDDRPILETRNGNLFIISAIDRNITLVTSGKSYVNVNDINLLEVSLNAHEASQIVQNWENGYLRSMTSELHQIKDDLDGPMGVKKRLNNLEFGGDSTTNSSHFRPGGFNPQDITENLIIRQSLRQVTSKVRVLERNVRTIRNKLRMNECSSDPCNNGGTCIRTFGGFQCLCTSTWEGPTCSDDVNECATFVGTDIGCQNGATCTNLPGSYRCSCATGWHGIHCTLKSNACDAQDSRELCGHGTCLTKPGTALGYTCICEQGWQSEALDPACVSDVNECNGKHPACSMDPLVTCINLPGTYHCGSCPRGFTGNGHYCTDIDECAIDNGGCSVVPHVECMNTRGSSSCGPCPAGYQGNGVSCVYLGLCRINNGGCHPLASCSENNLYPVCTCPRGYRGDGMGPNGCVPGVSALGPCDNNPCGHGRCEPDGALYVCRCSPGWTGTHCDTRADPCLPNPCQNNGICRSTDFVTVTCECKPLWSGHRCETMRQQCGGKFTNPSGTLEYPLNGESYAAGLNCAFAIEINASMVLNITFTRFDLEKSENCNFDFLQIHDGENTASQFMGRFCGNELPLNGHFVTTYHWVYLWLKTDRSIGHAGFSLHWESIPPTCGGYLTADHGTIQSPGSPGKYPNNKDCVWEIDVRPGRRILFHFFTMLIEPHATCGHDYLEINESSLGRNSQLGLYCNHTHPMPLTTSGSFVTLHFHSDASVNDVGFQLTYSTIEGYPGCGGVFTDDHGIITSPNFPSDYPSDRICDYRIQLPRNEKILLTWMFFELEGARTCRFDYVRIYEGPSVESPLAGTHCGRNLPAPIPLNTNEALLVFKSDFSNEYKGFQVKYETICGGKFLEPSGQLRSPYYPNNYPASRTCIYEIIQPINKGIVLTIVDLQMESGGDWCYFDSLTIYDGDNENSTSLAELCGSTVPDQPYYSTHNMLYIKFETDSSRHNRGFLANYTIVDRRCGGLLKTPTGIIQSPTDSSTYPYSDDCTWIIRAPVGHVVRLTFSTFSVEGDSTCTDDYVVVYDGSVDSGNQIKRFCGGTIPNPLMTQGESMTIVFHAGHDYEGFLAHYVFLDASKVCGGHYSTATGVIMSPNYPKHYPANRDCVWVITAPNKQLINLEVEHFDLEEVSRCSFDYLEIRNGGYATSPLLDKYCRENIPRNMRSLTNELYLRFVSDSSRHYGGFKIRWDTSTSGCGGTLTGFRGEIISPGYPQPYSRNALCDWKIAVASGNKLQLVMVDFDLEDHSRCRFDYVEFTAGHLEHSNTGKRYCGNQLPPFIDFDSNIVNIRFRSDFTNSGRGFHIRYETLCVNEVRGFNGVIESPNFPNDYPAGLNCTWIISAPLGNKINVTFSHFELEEGALDSRCTMDYLKIREGENGEVNTDIATLCGNDIREHIGSTQNQLFINFITDEWLSYKGFRLEWYTVGCGGHLKRPSGEITSLNYPNTYPRNIDCEWLIEVETGNSIEITFQDVNTEKSDGCVYDKIILYAGSDSEAPKLAQFCHSAGPVKHTSPLNKMFIHFHSDYTFAGRGFRATYKTVDATCGGNFRGDRGFIQSANYPRNYPNHQNCEWLIEVDKSHVVNLTFTDFDIESTINCTDDYVEIFDGNSRDNTSLGRHCKSDLPQPMVSTGNMMLVVMRSDSHIQAKGFRAQFVKACGARLFTDSSGVLETTQLLHFDNEINCTWIVIAQDPADHITLNFVHMDVDADYSWGEECENNYLRVYEGDGVEGPVRGTWCSNKVPPPIISTGRALTIHLYALWGGIRSRFGATYSVLNTACGGEYLSASGSLASPQYPESYPPNSECVWLLKTTPGNRISLTFSMFEIETSPNCDRDYLEIREDSGIGKLLKISCGEPPEPITSSSKLWIKFHSDEAGTGKGFVGEYTFLHGNELTGISGEIASPLYPHLWTNSEPISWRITAAFGMVVKVEFDDVLLQSYGDECLSSVVIYDGYNEGAAELGTVCGFAVPRDPFISTSNVAYIKFMPEYYGEGGSFHLRWYQAPMDSNKKSTTEELPNCVTEYDMTTPENRTMTFESPGWPDGYNNVLECKWIFTTQPGYHLSIRFTAIDLEEMAKCPGDHVQVYNGNGLSTDMDDLESLNKFCHANETTVVSVGKTALTVVLRFNSFHAKGGFRALVWKDCGGELTGPNGVIDLNETLSIYNRRVWNVMCEWNITVRPGRTIEITFENFLAHSEDENVCKDNYVLLKNGGSPDSPILGSGKYCDRNRPEGRLETNSNKLYLKASGEHWLINFRMTFKEISVACGETYVLGEDDKPLEITTPNYPNIPPPFSECTWTFMSSRGERLSIHFMERFDLTPHPNCTQEYVEMRDGGTEHSQSMGKYCGSKGPSSKKTSGNMLWVHFYTEVHDPKNGFKAVVTVGEVCGGVLRGKKGVIKSPNYPSQYPINLYCVWWIDGPSTNTLKIQFQDMYLPSMMNCELGDYVSVNDKIASNNSVIPVGTYCGRTIPDPIRTISNEAVVMFMSDNRTSDRLRGFSLNYTSSRDPCGGSLSGVSGEFTTNDYPNPSTHGRYCRWAITVPEGSHVVLDIVDMDVLASHREISSATNIVFSNDRLYYSKITVSGDPKRPQQVKSTSNFMAVSYYYYSGQRGLKAQYRAEAPALCGGIVENFSGKLLPPPAPYNDSSFYCNWKVRAPDIMRDPENPRGHTLTLRVSGNIGDSTTLNSDCQYRLKYIRANDGNRDFVHVCGNITNGAYVARTPTLVNTIEAVNGTSTGLMKFDLSYEWTSCGGILTGPSHTISITQTQNLPYPRSCVWHVKFEDPGSAIIMSFNRLNIGPCDKAYISIRNGGPLSPHRGNICGNIIPDNITSSRNELWIEYSASQAPADFEFQLNLASGSCGGVFRGSSRELSSPKFPQKYLNNVECTWEIIGSPSHKIGLYFVDRFNLETSANCSNDFLQIFEWLYDQKGHGSWVPGPKYCGRDTPNVFNSTSNHLKVLFRTNEAIQADGFRAMWEENCGGVFEATGRVQYIETPNYPLRYPNNSICNYTIISPSGKDIQLQFEDFHLEGSVGNCRYDNVTISYKESWWRTIRQVLCGDQLPSSFSARDKVTVIFQSDSYVRERGFRMKYFFNECGGEITEPTELVPPKNADNKYYNGLNCTWVIRAPEGMSVTLRFETFELEQGPNCIRDEVRIVEGDNLEGKKIASLCGSLPGKFSVPSEGNVMTMMFKTDSSVQREGMTALVIFTKGPAGGCGGKINLTETQTFKTQKGATYDILEDCHWTVSTEVGKNIRFTINQIDLKNATTSTHGNVTGNCTGDYLEVRDGGPFDELIGQFCGNEKPKVIVSTMNMLSIRLFTDGSINGEGVVGTLETIASECGELRWNIHNRTTFESPNWPSDFPAGTHCRWLFKAAGDTRQLQIHFEEMDMEDTSKCEGDHIEISDKYGGYVSEGFGEDLVFNGRRNRQQHFALGSWNPHASFKYCGQANQFDYYSTNSEILVSLKSNTENLPKPRKFKFVVSMPKCDRNYTAEQGRIVHKKISECWTTITTEPNRTISIYFNSVYYIGGTCESRYIEFHDGDFNAPVLQKVCEFGIASSIFSTGNKLSIYAKSQGTQFYYSSNQYDFTYTTTDRGRGCGGKIYNYRGSFTSPMYPSNYRNDTTCEWEISVPRGNQVELDFDTFDIGSSDMCETDYLQVEEQSVSAGRSELYCPGTRPAPFRASGNVVKVTYVSSVNNGGTGWRISFSVIKGKDVFVMREPYLRIHPTLMMTGR